MIACETSELGDVQFEFYGFLFLTVVDGTISYMNPHEVQSSCSGHCFPCKETPKPLPAQSSESSGNPPFPEAHKSTIPILESFSGYESGSFAYQLVSPVLLSS